jgi:iron complex outermembrane recepter protein
VSGEKGGRVTIPATALLNLLGFIAFNLNNRLYFNHLAFFKNFAPWIGRGVRLVYTIRFF